MTMMRSASSRGRPWQRAVAILTTVSVTVVTFAWVQPAVAAVPQGAIVDQPQVTPTERLAVDILESEDFKSGRYTTAFLAEASLATLGAASPS